MQPTPPDNPGTPTRPYLIRALHQWCTDNGFTPYIAVFVDSSVQVPADYVKNDEIVMNVSFDATRGLELGNEFIEFRTRFGGVVREIVVPVDRVVAIYARENGQGMAFPMPSSQAVGSAASGVTPAEAPPPTPLRLAAVDDGDVAEQTRPMGEDGDEPPPAAPRPPLKRVK
jgi:stringent starvation protein B